MTGTADVRYEYIAEDFHESKNVCIGDTDILRFREHARLLPITDRYENENRAPEHPNIFGFLKLNSISQPRNNRSSRCHPCFAVPLDCSRG